MKDKVNKSLSVLKQMVEYGKDMYELIDNKAQFEYCILDRSIGKSEDCTLSVCYLVLTRSGLEVLRKFNADGYEVIEKINTSTPYKNYAYNSDDNKTIELAVYLVRNWQRVKDNIVSGIEDYNKSQDEEMKLLDSFVV